MIQPHLLFVAALAIGFASSFGQSVPLSSEAGSEQPERQRLESVQDSLEALRQAPLRRLQCAPPWFFRIGSRWAELESDAELRRLATQLDRALGEQAVRSGGFAGGGPLLGAARRLPFAPDVALVHIECGPYDAPDGSRKLVWGEALIRGESVRPLAMGAFRQIPGALGSLDGQFPGLKLTLESVIDFVRLESHLVGLNGHGVVESLADLRARLRDPGALAAPLASKVASAVRPIRVERVAQSSEGVTYFIDSTIFLFGKILPFKVALYEDGTGRAHPDGSAEVLALVDGLPEANDVQRRSVPAPATKTAQSTEKGAKAPGPAEPAPTKASAVRYRAPALIRELEAAKPISAAERVRAHTKYALTIRASRFVDSSRLERLFEEENLRSLVADALRARGSALAEESDGKAAPLVLFV
ncbi:MAG: hypothetical protein SFY95_04815, partial [Planctomycetota bacterium]|nr:hypothetical protein [Planctomycetota bacterium]